MPEIYADSIEAKVDGTNQIVPIRDITKAPAITESTSGESIQLSDSADAPLTDIKLYGKSKQDGEPSPDNPVEINIPGSGGNIGVNFAGKNMVPYPYENGSITVRGIKFTVNDDGSILINGTATDTAYLKLSNSFNPNIYAGKYFYAFDSDFIANINSVIFRIGNVNDNTSIQDLSNGIKINPSNKIGFLEIRVASGYTANNVLVKPFISPEQNYNYNDYISPLPSQIVNILTPNGLPGIPVNSGGNYTDAEGQQWISDYVDFERGKYVQNIKIRTVDNDTVIKQGGVTNGYGINNFIIDEDVNGGNILCNLLSRQTTLFANTQTEGIMSSSRSIYIRLKNDNFPDVESVKAWAVSNNLKYMFIKENPVITQLQNEELEAYKALMTYYPNTNINTDTDPQVSMEVEYTADTKTWIENKLTEIQTQILNMQA